MYSCLIFLILIPWRYSTCLNCYFDANLAFDWFQNVLFSSFFLSKLQITISLSFEKWLSIFFLFSEVHELCLCFKGQFHLPLNILIPPARNKRRKKNLLIHGPEVLCSQNQGQSRNYKVGQLIDKCTVHRLSIDKIRLKDIKFEATL